MNVTSAVFREVNKETAFVLFLGRSRTSDDIDM